MPAYFESGFSVKEQMWHGLGSVLAENDPARYDVTAAMKAAGAEFGVYRAPLQVAASLPSDRPDDVGLPAEAVGRTIADKYAVLRDDTHEVLGVVGAAYRPLQSSKLFGWFQPWLETGEVAFETAGVLKGGRIVWALASIRRDDALVVPGDAVKKYLLLTTSHDGSIATSVGFCPIRVVCWNTLSAGLRDRGSSLLRVKHTRGQERTLRLIRETVNLIDRQFEATAEQYRRLATCKIASSDLRRYVRIVMGVGEDEELSTRRRNQFESILDLAVRGRGQDLAPGTAWAAYNGVTEWLSHRRQADAAKRLESNWYGDSRKLNERALAVALQLAG